VNKPLAAALRPEKLEDVCGQQHLLNKDAVFRRAIENGAIQNMIFYGPSGVGKTTVASIIARMADKKLFKLNGTQSSTADIKEIIAQVNTLGAEMVFCCILMKFSISTKNSSSLCWKYWKMAVLHLLLPQLKIRISLFSMLSFPAVQFLSSNHYSLPIYAKA
jgi:ATP-dependent protease HslVU (ClpYQ) ATPase subunit